MLGRPEKSHRYSFTAGLTLGSTASMIEPLQFRRPHPIRSEVRNFRAIREHETLRRRNPLLECVNPGFPKLGIGNPTTMLVIYAVIFLRKQQEGNDVESVLDELRSSQSLTTYEL